MSIITREGMEKALQQLFDNEDLESVNFAAHWHIKEYLKVVEAEQVFNAPSDLPATMKVHWARKSDEYKQHILAIQEALRVIKKDSFRRDDNELYNSQFQTLTKAGAL